MDYKNAITWIMVIPSTLNRWCLCYDAHWRSEVIIDLCLRSTLVAKVFIWRVLIGGLPLGLALKHRGLATGNWFFALFKRKIVLIDLYNV